MKKYVLALMIVAAGLGAHVVVGQTATPRPIATEAEVTAFKAAVIEAKLMGYPDDIINQLFYSSGSTFRELSGINSEVNCKFLHTALRKVIERLEVTSKHFETLMNMAIRLEGFNKSYPNVIHPINKAGTLTDAQVALLNKAIGDTQADVKFKTVMTNITISNSLSLTDLIVARYMLWKSSLYQKTGYSTLTKDEKVHSQAITNAIFYKAFVVDQPAPLVTYDSDAGKWSISTGKEAEFINRAKTVLQEAISKVFKEDEQKNSANLSLLFDFVGKLSDVITAISTFDFAPIRKAYEESQEEKQPKSLFAYELNGLLFALASKSKDPNVATKIAAVENLLDPIDGKKIYDGEYVSKLPKNFVRLEDAKTLLKAANVADLLILIPKEPNWGSTEADLMKYEPNNPGLKNLVARIKPFILSNKLSQASIDALYNRTLDNAVLKSYLKRYQAFVNPQSFSRDNVITFVPATRDANGVLTGPASGTAVDLLGAIYAAKVGLKSPQDDQLKADLDAAMKVLVDVVFEGKIDNQRYFDLLFFALQNYFVLETTPPDFASYVAVAKPMIQELLVALKLPPTTSDSNARTLYNRFAPDKAVPLVSIVLSETDKAALDFVASKIQTFTAPQQDDIKAEITKFKTLEVTDDGKARSLMKFIKFADNVLNGKSLKLTTADEFGNANLKALAVKLDQAFGREQLLEENPWEPAAAAPAAASTVQDLANKAGRLTAEQIDLVKDSLAYLTADTNKTIVDNEIDDKTKAAFADLATRFTYTPDFVFSYATSGDNAAMTDLVLASYAVSKMDDAYGETSNPVQLTTGQEDLRKGIKVAVMSAGYMGAAPVLGLSTDINAPYQLLANDVSGDQAVTRAAAIAGLVMDKIYSSLGKIGGNKTEAKLEDYKYVLGLMSCGSVAFVASLIKSGDNFRTSFYNKFDPKIKAYLPKAIGLSSTILLGDVASLQSLNLNLTIQVSETAPFDRNYLSNVGKENGMPLDYSTEVKGRELIRLANLADIYYKIVANATRANNQVTFGYMPTDNDVKLAALLMATPAGTDDNSKQLQALIQKIEDAWPAIIAERGGTAAPSAGSSGTNAINKAGKLTEDQLTMLKTNFVKTLPTAGYEKLPTLVGAFAKDTAVTKDTQYLFPYTAAGANKSAIELMFQLVALVTYARHMDAQNQPLIKVDQAKMEGIKTAFLYAAFKDGGTEIDANGNIKLKNMADLILRAKALMQAINEKADPNRDSGIYYFNPSYKYGQYEGMLIEVLSPLLTGADKTTLRASLDEYVYELYPLLVNSVEEKAFKEAASKLNSNVSPLKAYFNTSYVNSIVRTIGSIVDDNRLPGNYFSEIPATRLVQDANIADKLLNPNEEKDTELMNLPKDPILKELVNKIVKNHTNIKIVDKNTNVVANTAYDAVVKQAADTSTIAKAFIARTDLSDADKVAFAGYQNDANMAAAKAEAERVKAKAALDKSDSQAFDAAAAAVADALQAAKNAGLQALPYSQIAAQVNIYAVDNTGALKAAFATYNPALVSGQVMDQPTTNPATQTISVQSYVDWLVEKYARYGKFAYEVEKGLTNAVNYARNVYENWGARFSWYTAAVPVIPGSTYPDVASAAKRCVEKITDPNLVLKVKRGDTIVDFKPSDDLKTPKKKDIYAVSTVVKSQGSLKKIYCGAVFAEVQGD